MGKTKYGNILKFDWSFQTAITLKELNLQSKIPIMDLLELKLTIKRNSHGLVLAVKEELVKIKLDRDKEQLLEKAYWYPWRPDVGSRGQPWCAGDTANTYEEIGLLWGRRILHGKRLFGRGCKINVYQWWGNETASGSHRTWVYQ